MSHSISLSFQISTIRFAYQQSVVQFTTSCRRGLSILFGLLVRRPCLYRGVKHVCCNLVASLITSTGWHLHLYLVSCSLYFCMQTNSSASWVNTKTAQPGLIASKAACNLGHNHIVTTNASPVRHSECTPIKTVTLHITQG